MAKRRVYVPKDLEYLSKLGTHELNHRRSPALQGSIIKTAKGSRKFVPCDPEKRLSINKLGVNTKIVGAKPRVEDQYPRWYRAQMIQRKRRTAMVIHWMYQKKSMWTNDLKVCIPFGSLETLYSSAY